MVAKSVLIILGLHRSGSSVLTGCLKILGAGFENTGRASQDVQNEIISIHEILLKELGCHWDMIGNLPKGWVESQAAETAKERLKGLFQNDFSKSGLWVLGDHRLCRLMALWMSIFKDWDVTPIFIHMLRHPFEVAQSLKINKGIDLHKGHLLWMVHNRDALSAINDYHRIIITYDQLLADPIATLNSISEKLEITYPVRITQSAQQILEFVRLELKHQHYSQMDHSGPFDHFSRLYEQLRLNQIRHIQPMPCQDDLKEKIENPEMDDAASLLLMFLGGFESLDRSDQLQSVRLFNDVLDRLSRYESAEQDFNNRYQCLQAMTDQNAAVMYARGFFPCSNVGEKDYDPDNAFKEILLPEEWQHLKMEVPQSHKLEKNGLCINPLNQIGMIQISAIRLKHVTSAQVFWEVNSGNGFGHCRVEGTALCLDNSNEFKILSTGHEPQIIISSMPEIPDVPLMLEIWIKVSRDLSEVAHMWAGYQDQDQIQKKQIEDLQSSIERSEFDRIKANRKLENLRERYNKSESERARIANKFEVLRSSIEQSEFDRTRANRKLENLRERYKKSESEWAIKAREIEKNLDSQVDLCREYCSALADTENGLVRIREREEALKLLIYQLENDFHALLKSFRWRLGNRVICIGEWLMRRKKQPLAVDHMRKLFDQSKIVKKTKKASDASIFKSMDDPCSIKKINGLMGQLKKDFKALKNSKRWKMGNVLIRGLEILTLRPRKNMAIDHLENIFKDYEKISAGQEIMDIKALQSFLLQPEKDFKAIEKSMRWKVGDSFFSFVDQLLLRGKMPTIFDHINSVYQEYNALQREK